MSDETQATPIDNDRLLAIEDRLARGAARMSEIEASLKRNTFMTQEVHDVLMAARSGLAAIAKFGRGLAAVGRWFLKFARVAGILASAGLAIWAAAYALTHGGVPPPPK